MPRYDAQCRQCGQMREVFLTYTEFARTLVVECDCRGERTPHELVPFRYAPPVHLKGYGFYTTDNRSQDEKYAFDHFDGSGTNAEMKAMQRRIKDPESTIPMKRDFTP